MSPLGLLKRITKHHDRDRGVAMPDSGSASGSPAEEEEPSSKRHDVELFL